MKTPFFLTFFLLSIIGFGQTKFNSENYIVSRDDIETNTFKKDSTAHALVIYEFGSSYLDQDSYKLKTEIKRKIKILDREGFSHANVIVGLYNNDQGSSKEKISNIQATTSNIENGNIVRTKLENNQIFREQYNNNITRVKFTLPNIKEGSVISYSYTLETPFLFKYRGWSFQNDIPTLYSEYRASIPGNYEYNIKLVGEQKLDVNEATLKKKCLVDGTGASADCLITKYVMKNVPAFIEEDFMTTRDNYLSRVDYELKILRGFDGGVKNYTKTWKTTDKDLKTEQSIGRQLNKKSIAKGLLSSEIAKEKNQLKKAQDIFKYVQENYTWNKEFNLFKEVSLKNLVKSKSGRASEINLLLFNLLNANDIDVKTVLISTRANGLATKIYPVLTDFNYLIVQATIDGNTYLLDAVDPYLAFGQLSFRCLNQYGRLLDLKDGSYWLPFTASKTTTKTFRTELTFNDEGNIEGSIKSKKTGYHALSAKRKYFSNSSEYLKAYKDAYTAMDITNHEVSTKEKNSETFKETFNVTVAPEIIGENIYLNPFLFKYISENPFKLQERTYPIDFGYKEAYLYNFKIDLNGKYEVVELPKSLSMKLPNNTGVLLVNTKHEGDSVMVFFKFSFNEAIYTSNYYNHLKSFFSHIVNTQNNSLIVLKEK